MMWDGYGYARESRQVSIPHYPVSWKFLVSPQLFTDGILGDNGAV